MILKTRAQRRICVLVGSVLLSFLVGVIWFKTTSARFMHGCKLSMYFISQMISGFYHENDDTYPKSWDDLTSFFLHTEEHDLDPVKERLRCPYIDFRSRLFWAGELPRGPVLATSMELKKDGRVVVAYCDHGQSVILAINGGRVLVVTKSEFVEQWGGTE